MNVLERILDTAESLFNRNGFTSVGIDFIRDEAEVSKTTIYRHFSSKTELIEKVLRRRHKRFEDSLAVAVNSYSDVNGKINALLEWHFSWFDSDYFEGCMFMHALSEFKQQDQNICKVVEDHKLWLCKLILGILGEYSDEKFVRAELMMTFLEGMIIRAEFSALNVDRNYYKREMIRIALNS